MIDHRRTRFEIRPARSDDEIAAVISLFQAYADSIGIDLGYQDFAGELAGLPGKFAPPDGELLVAMDGAGQPVGCVALRPLADPGICEMKRLFVAPVARGTGLGKQLVEQILDAARRRGYWEMRLDTLPSMAAAQGMYRAFDFMPIPAYYDTPIEGTLFLALQLND